MTVFLREETHACVVTPSQAEQKIMFSPWTLRVQALEGKSILAPFHIRKQKIIPSKNLPVPFMPAQSSTDKISLLT